jgi:hypothetical protein
VATQYFNKWADQFFCDLNLCFGEISLYLQNYHDGGGQFLLWYAFFINLVIGNLKIQVLNAFLSFFVSYLFMKQFRNLFQIFSDEYADKNHEILLFVLSLKSIDFTFCTAIFHNGFLEFSVNSVGIIFDLFAVSLILFICKISNFRKDGLVFLPI